MGRIESGSELAKLLPDEGGRSTSILWMVEELPSIQLILISPIGTGFPFVMAEINSVSVGLESAYSLRYQQGSAPQRCAKLALSAEENHGLAARIAATTGAQK